MPPASPAITKLAEALAALLAEAPPPSALAPNALPAPLSWRERLWSCPPDTRLGLAEVCEALGRSKAFFYRLTRTKEIPFRKLDGALVFRAGDVCSWVKQREDVVVRPVH